MTAPDLLALADECERAMNTLSRLSTNSREYKPLFYATNRAWHELSHALRELNDAALASKGGQS